MHTHPNHSHSFNSHANTLHYHSPCICRKSTSFAHAFIIITLVLIHMQNHALHMHFHPYKTIIIHPHNLPSFTQTPSLHHNAATCTCSSNISATCTPIHFIIAANTCFHMHFQIVPLHMQPHSLLAVMFPPIKSATCIHHHNLAVIPLHCTCIFK